MNGFALWVGFGAGLGLWRLARSSPQRQAATWVNVGLLVLFATLIGARLFYTWENREYFAAHLTEIAQIRLGGLAWPGAIGGAWAVLLVLAITSRGLRSNHMPLGLLGDRMYPLLPPLSISIWLGCWAAGVAYGPAAPANAWWSVPSLDESGIYNPHWPLQPLAALSLIAFFWLLEACVPSQTEGRLSGLAVCGLLIHLLFTTLLRADPAPVWHGLRVDTWIAAAYLAAFLIMLFFTQITSRIRKRPAFSGSLDS